MNKTRDETPQERRDALEAYARFLEEAEREPIKYLKHDNRAHDDEALYRLVDAHGMAYYGLYWLLAEHLAARKDHSYDVSDEAGWRRLARDMGCMSDMSVEECKTFISELDAHGLISRENFEGLHKVVITRIRIDANAYAEGVAAKKLGAWKTNRKRMLS